MGLITPTNQSLNKPIKIHRLKQVPIEAHYF
jgi:hypothetical protein